MANAFNLNFLGVGIARDKTVMFVPCLALIQHWFLFQRLSFMACAASPHMENSQKNNKIFEEVLMFIFYVVHSIKVQKYVNGTKFEQRTVSLTTRNSGKKKVKHRIDGRMSPLERPTQMIETLEVEEEVSRPVIGFPMTLMLACQNGASYLRLE